MKVFVPEEVHFQDGRLHWKIDAPPRFRAAGFGMLQRFTDLHAKSESEILNFAKKWGVLGLCQHDLPASHSWILFGAQHGHNPCSNIPSNVAGFDFCEDIAEWRRFSAGADIVIQTAAKLNQDKLDDSGKRMLFVGAAMQEALHVNSQKRTPPRHSEMLREARAQLAREIDTWLQLGKIGLRFGRENDKWQISFASRAFPNLFGVLALKLAFHVAQVEGIVFCSTCPRAYIPEERRPSTKRANYCDTCKNDGTMWREIKRRQRKEGEK